jgi:hypothetical protein
VESRVETDPTTRNRYLRVKALTGTLRLAYGATVDLSHHVAEPAQIGEVPVGAPACASAELHLPKPLLSVGPPAQTCDAQVRPAVARIRPRAGGSRLGAAAHDFLVEHVEHQHLGDRDPSGTAVPMGLLRLGTGRVAADVAFAMIFGTVTSSAPRIAIEAIRGADGRLVTPHHSTGALSTDG